MDYDEQNLEREYIKAKYHAKGNTITERQIDEYLAMAEEQRANEPNPRPQIASEELAIYIQSLLPKDGRSIQYTNKDECLEKLAKLFDRAIDEKVERLFPLTLTTA